MMRSPPTACGGLRQSSTAVTDTAIVNRTSFQNLPTHSFKSAT